MILFHTSNTPRNLPGFRGRPLGTAVSVTCYGSRLPGTWTGRLFSRNLRSVSGRLPISDDGLARIALKFGTATGSAASRAARSPVGSCDSREVGLVSSAAGVLRRPVRGGGRVLSRAGGWARTPAGAAAGATGRLE